MPSVSKKQHNLMAAVAKNPAFAKKTGISQSVGSEFLRADKGHKFAKGGDMKKLPPFMGKETKAEEAKEMKIKAKSPAMYRKGEKAEGIHGKSGKEKPTKYAGGGFTKSADGVAQHGKTKAQKFATGGVPAAPNAFAKMQAMKKAMQDRRPADREQPMNAFAKMQAMRPAMRGSTVSAAEPTNGVGKMQPFNPQLTGRRPDGAVPQTSRGNAATSSKMQDFLSRIKKNKPTVTAAGPNPVGGAMKKGGCVKKTAKGGGCEVKGKTKGKYI